MKSVLAVADGGPALEATLTLAAHIADACKGQVDVLHVRDALAVNGGLAVASMVDGGGEVMMEDAQKTASERAVIARSAFERIAKVIAGARFVEVEGNETDIIVERARLSDVVVVGRPGADDLKPEPQYVPAAIYEGARPVAVAPPGWKAQAFRHATVAWNGSGQSARAVGYAMPLLTQADSVTVFTASDGDPITTDGILEYLGRYGVKARVVNVALGSGSGRTRGRALLKYIDDASTNLLVMGAYGQQGIMRFLGLGGATGKVIEACKVPVFLAH
jgi:nucleotide-binding universal stress UspA family protein